MAVYTYSVTNSDVLAEVPGIDAGQIGASTEPVSTADVDQWIIDGSSQINGLLEKAGHTPSSSLEEDTHAALATAVKNYAVAKVLLVIGQTGEVYQRAWDTWMQAYSEFSNRPENLGATAPSRATTSSIKDADDDLADEWDFVGFKATNMW